MGGNVIDFLFLRFGSLRDSDHDSPVAGKSDNKNISDPLFDRLNSDPLNNSSKAKAKKSISKKILSKAKEGSGVLKYIKTVLIGKNSCKNFLRFFQEVFPVQAGGGR